MNDSAIISFCGEGVARITLQLGPANAYHAAFLSHIGALLAELESNDRIRVVIIDSALSKFFCAGADIRVFEKNSVAQNLELVHQARHNAETIEGSRKIYIAEVAGHCLGGGLELAMACDFIFAAEGSFRLGLPEIKLGLIPGNGGTQRLVRRAGSKAAMKLLLRGDTVDVAESMALGLLDAVFPVATLRDSVTAFASEIAQGPALALAATKRCLRDGSSLPLAQGLQLEAGLADALYETPDAREGLLAFTEKRPAQFNQ